MKTQVLSAVVMFGLVVSAPRLHGQGLPEVTIAPELKALVAVKAHMRESLLEIPDYVCRTTVHRLRLNERQRRKIDKRLSKRGAGASNSRETLLADFSDVVELDVAVVDGSEMFSWPGGEFEALSPADLIGFGMMANGSFLSFAKSIFVTSQGRTVFAGSDDFSGTRALRYDYEVSLFRSGYNVSTVSGSATVGFRGSFWVDQETHRLLRLSREATDLPFQLALERTSTVIDYEEVMISGETFTLPSKAVDGLFYTNGAMSRNETVFGGCRRFGSKSTLSFNASENLELPDDSEATREKAISLPEGLDIALRLSHSVNSRSAVVGGEVSAEVSRDVTVSDAVVLRKGASLRGRIRRVQRIGSDSDPYWAVALTFSELTSSGLRAALNSRLVDIQSTKSISREFRSEPTIQTSRRNYGMGEMAGTVTVTESIEDVDTGIDGMDTFYIRGKRWTLPRGFRMTIRVVGEE